MANRIWLGTAADGNWGTASNWSGSAVPVTGDDVEFLFGADAIILGLAQSAVTLASMTIYPGFAGSIGVVGPTGASLAIGITTLTILGSSGGGNGNSSGVFGSAGITLFKWTPGSDTHTTTIDGSGASSDTFGSAVQIYGGTNTSNLYVNGGTVDVAMVPGQTATLQSVSVGGTGTVNGGPGLTCPTFAQNGTGSNLLVSNATTTLTSLAGNLATLGTGLIGTLTVGGSATLNHRASGNSITTLAVLTNGQVDFSQNPAGILIANPVQMYRSSTLTAFSKGQIQLAGPASIQFALQGCGIGDIAINLGTQGQTITVA